MYLIYVSTVFCLHFFSSLHAGKCFSKAATSDVVRTAIEPENYTPERLSLNNADRKENENVTIVEPVTIKPCKTRPRLSVHRSQIRIALVQENSPKSSVSAPRHRELTQSITILEFMKQENKRMQKLTNRPRLNGHQRKA